MIKDKLSLQILFIAINPRPNWTKEQTFIDFPIGLCKVISEAERVGYKYDLLDLQVNPKSERELREFIGRKNYDVIAFGTLSHAYHIIKPLIKMIKEINPNTKVVVGSYVASTMPEKLLTWTDADVAVIGEGHITLIEVLDRIIAREDFSGIKGIAHKNNGEIIRELERPPVANLDDMLFPIWDIFDVESYIQSSHNLMSHNFYQDQSLRRLPILASTGCPFRCTFCTNSKYHKYNPFRYHSTEYIVKMIKMLNKKYNINHIRFFDEITFVNIKQAAPLVNALYNEKLDVQFEAVCRIGFLQKGDEAFAKKMREAGFVMLNTGLESANSEILKVMNKRIKKEWFYQQKQVFDKAGIQMSTNLILGYPQETEESMAETFKVCYDNNIMPSVGFLLPAPGSKIYDWAIEQGFIHNEEEYIINIGERQYMNMNMTSMSNKTIYDTTLYHLKRIREKIGLDIPDNHLICSMIFKDETS